MWSTMQEKLRGELNMWLARFSMMNMGPGNPAVAEVLVAVAIRMVADGNTEKDIETGIRRGHEMVEAYRELVRYRPAAKPRPRGNRGDR